jgi:hypothetical protein
MASKNKLKPKAYAKTNTERWSHLTGYELENFSDYTRDQIRAIATKYGVKSVSSFKTVELLVEAIQETEGYQLAGKKNRKTLYEELRERTNGESKTISWYRQEFNKMISKIKREPSRMTIDQRMDSVQNIVNQDQNELRRRPFVGHMYFFEYQAISDIPYYDTFPLVFVLKYGGEYFYGANLHYLSYKERSVVVKKLESGNLEIPRNIIHKYLIRECKSLFLDLASYEWETAAMLPLEGFVWNKGNKKLEYDKDLVWEEIQNEKSKKIRASVRRK